MFSLQVFQHASGLSRHLIIHTGRTFDCEQCGRKFTDKSALKRHVSTLHQINEQKPIKQLLDEQSDMPKPIKLDPLLLSEDNKPIKTSPKK